MFTIVDFVGVVNLIARAVCLYLAVGSNTLPRWAAVPKKSCNTLYISLVWSPIYLVRDRDAIYFLVLIKFNQQAELTAAVVSQRVECEFTTQRGLIWTTNWNGLNGQVTNHFWWYRDKVSPTLSVVTMKPTTNPGAANQPPPYIPQDDHTNTPATAIQILIYIYFNIAIHSYIITLHACGCCG